MRARGPVPVLVAAFALGSLAAVPEAPPPRGRLASISEKTSGMQRYPGFLPVAWDAPQGRVFLEIARLGEELLYYTSLPSGVGSNDIGLDRGQLGAARLVRFDRIGSKVLLVAINVAFRSASKDALERQTVTDSFATSVLWGFEVVAESGKVVLVDATDFLLHDAHDAIGALERSKQGKYSVDLSRSAPHPAGMRAFPKNTELEATLTLTTSEKPGAAIGAVTPLASSVTFRERHSFVELPDLGFAPRPADPRAGYFDVAHTDPATPLGAPLLRRLALRHRLRKRDPAQALSEPVEPIVYHVDAGAPEPIRSALVEGARWWNAAFEKIGYEDAFRVTLLPPDADALDVRYNVIQWVHRATRGWSYGSAVVDPRTGEILKGHVTLDALRARQDYLIAEGLLSPYATGNEEPAELSAVALARIRQLAAHEVGHTLGLEHNFLASALTPGGRASVMDYPHPRTRLLADGTIDLTDAYGVGVGAWDDVAIAWGYQDFPTGTDEPAELERILAEARGRGLAFLTDQDARPFGSAHPRASLWDDGADASAELARVMDVRRAALARFGDDAIRRGTPLATIEEALVPLYFHHRYQAAAAVKSVGGVDYAYALRGDGQQAQRPVPAAEQERALTALLRTLTPKELAIPSAILARIPPRPPGYDAQRELFKRTTGVVFDPIAPAEGAAGLCVAFLLEPERAARLVAQRALDPDLPGLDTVLGRLIAVAFDPAAATTPYEAEIARAVRVVAVDGIMGLAANAAMPQVRALARLELEELAASLATASPGDLAERASRRALAVGIERFLSGKDGAKVLPSPPAPPPGEPIGRDYN